MSEELTAGQSAEFSAETRRLLRRRSIVACVLAMSIAPLYSASDYYLLPDHFFKLLGWRLACLLLTGLILLALRSPAGKARPEWLALCLGVEVGFMVSGVPVLLAGYDTPYFVGLILVILTAALLMPLADRDSTLLSGALTLTYVGVALSHGGIDNVAIFVTNASLIVTSGIVALVGGRAGMELRRREFRTRSTLQEALQHESELAAELQRQAARLEAANQEMEDLLYVASHDLRAPLINVQGFTRELQLGLTELRREIPTLPEARAAFADIDESLQFILTAVSRMDNLIGSLLNVSRVATRTSPTERVALGTMVDKIIDSFRYQLDQKQITVAIGNLPEVIGDGLRLNQALSNLIDNAIKCMGDRSVRRIEIGAETQGDICACYVRDSGPGIPKEKRERIFRLFHRLGNGLAPGEGIGLTIVRKIIEKHGGRVWVEAGEGAGSTFWFTLHCAPREPPSGGVHVSVSQP
jgi:signal transduction histidine kinase